MTKARAWPPPVGRARWGDLDGTEPVSRRFGGDRGRPLDRYYIEGFLERHRGDIAGRVAEIGEALYTERFGRGAVTSSAILDAPGSGNPHATLLADLQTGDGVPGEAFDAFVVTQTLHMIYDVRGALATLHRSLAPGGVLLATVPGITPIDAADGPEKWFWPMTQTGARRLVAGFFGPDNVEVRHYGNVYAATAFLQGFAFEELDRGKLDVVDPLFPVITGIRAVKR